MVTKATEFLKNVLWFLIFIIYRKGFRVQLKTPLKITFIQFRIKIFN
jgi:hypothetical protein